MRLELQSLTQEEVGLFNPAFCGRMVVDAADEYRKQDQKGMPYVLAFVIIPLALHPEVRQALPRTVRTPFPTWIAENERLRVGFSDRAMALAPFVKAGIRLAIRSDLLVLEAPLLVQGGRTGRMSAATSEDCKKALKAARFLSRWFHRSGSPETIYVLLGVRP